MLKQKQIRYTMILIAFVGFGAGLFTGQYSRWIALERQYPATVQDVVSFAQRYDVAKDDFRETALLGSSAFYHVVGHINEYVEMAGPERCWPDTLYVMIWRAAFLYGSEEVVLSAFDKCSWKSSAAQWMAYDLAGWEGQSLVRVIPWKAKPQALTKFLEYLSDRHPNRYGLTDYTQVLERLTTEGPGLTRLYAAFCLAKWYGPGNRLGSGAVALLRNASNTAPGIEKTQADLLLTTLQIQGPLTMPGVGVAKRLDD